MGEVLGSVADHVPCGVEATGEGDPCHEWMAGERSASGFAESGDEVDDARRKPDAVDHLGELQERPGCMLGRFDDDGAAGGKRRANLRGGQEHFRVPRHDCAHDTNGFGSGEDLHVGFVDGQGLAVDLVGHAAEVAVVVGHVRRLHAGLGGELPAVGRFDLPQPVGGFGHGVGELEQVGAPLSGGEFRPFAFVHGVMRGPNGAVDIGFSGRSAGGPHGVRRRVDGLEGAAVGGLAELSIDVQLKVRHFVPSCSSRVIPIASMSE